MLFLGVYLAEPSQDPLNSVDDKYFKRLVHTFAIKLFQIF